jgi:Ni/Co efflux regulator RcnB
MFKIFLSALVITSSIAITACSPAEEKTTKEIAAENPGTEHFASDQKRALDKANGVEQMLQESADKRALEIEKQTK